MTLSDLQTRLEEHFTRLCAARRATEGGRPLFALEHGLNATELAALSTAVRAHVRTSSPSRSHALPWLVYATEIGYDYVGDEYWQTFEERTPGWTQHGQRSWLRDEYRDFAATYGGARPSGAWAEQFSIICWPITHAILPCDLQRQLARILFELRHTFSAEVLESPDRLGEFIATRKHTATSRFQNFAQEPKLLGQIAAALLAQEPETSNSLIHPATLQRISADLDRERRARDWLRGARSYAQQRARVRGLHFTPVDGRPLGEPRTAAAVLGIEPRLVLRPRDACDTWAVMLEVPDLSHLLHRFPKAQEVLMGSRCRVAGSSGRPIARGRFLHGEQRIPLTRWPREDEVLLKFDQEVPELDYLLKTDCLLRPGPRWLFRVASDGLAYECRSLRVRPGQRYILIGVAPAPLAHEAMRAIQLECDGVHAAMLQLPEALSPAWEQAVAHLGLGQAKTVEVWPAGLVPAAWDDDGRGEWLATERPCLAIRSNHAVAAFQVSVDDDPASTLEVVPEAPGTTVFVELPQLDVGLHRVSVGARGPDGAALEALGELDVLMRIREVRAWSPGLGPQGPLNVQVEPLTPTLEQLWEGRVEVLISGPSQRKVKCEISLRDAVDGAAALTKQLPPLALPVTAERWRTHFNEHFREKTDAARAYDSAGTCEIRFEADELGAFELRCEREFTPLRWAVRRDGDGLVARLIDNNDGADHPALARRSFQEPCREERLAFVTSFGVPANGGLYVARRADVTAAVLVAPEIHSLADLRCTPQTPQRERSADAITESVSDYRLWAGARLSGGALSAARQRAVLEALLLQLFGIIGGRHWREAEERVQTGEPPGTLHPLHLAIGDSRGARKLADVVFGERLALAQAIPSTRVTVFTQLVARHLEFHGDWTCELGLRLASDPVAAETFAAGMLPKGIARLLELPSVARAARYVTLLVHRELGGSPKSGQLYAGWDWS